MALKWMETKYPCIYGGKLHSFLAPGGIFCCASTASLPRTELWSRVKAGVINPAFSSAGYWYGVLTKAAVCVNSTAADYWVDDSVDSMEKNVLEAVTITPTVTQRRQLQDLHLHQQLSPCDTQQLPSSFLSSAISQAVRALREYGVCILRGFFDPKVRILLFSSMQHMRAMTS